MSVCFYRLAMWGRDRLKALAALRRSEAYVRAERCACRAADGEFRWLENCKNYLGVWVALLLVLVVEVLVLQMLLLGLRHRLQLLLRLEVQPDHERRHQQAQNHLQRAFRVRKRFDSRRARRYLEVCVLPRPQPAHPEVGEDHLAARVGEQRPVVGGHGERQAALVRPRVQLARQQPLRALRVDAVAEVEQLHALRLEVFGVRFQFVVDLGVEVVLGRLVGHRLVQLGGDQRLGERLLAVRPHQDAHLLPLREHRPDEQLVERELEQRHFRRERKQAGHQAHRISARVSLERRRLAICIDVAVHHFRVDWTKFPPRVIGTVARETRKTQSIVPVN